MTRPCQKQEERFYLEEFLRCLNLKITQITEGSEPPDWVITDDAGHRIGIEVTTYHNNTPTPHGHTRREVESAWEELRGKIQKMVSTTPALKSVHGFLFFKELRLPKSGEQDQFVQELRQCVAEHLEQLPVKIDDLSNYFCLKTYLRKLGIKEVRCSLSWDFNLRTAWVGVDSKSFISLIRKKVKDVKKCSARQDFDECWLLVVSGMELSQSMGVPMPAAFQELKEVGDILSQSKFRKAYVFQYMFDTFHEWPCWREVTVNSTDRSNA